MNDTYTAQATRENRIAACRKMLDITHRVAEIMGEKLEIRASEDLMKAIKGEPFDKEMAILEFELLETRLAFSFAQAKFIREKLHLAPELAGIPLNIQ